MNNLSLDYINDFFGTNIVTRMNLMEKSQDIHVEYLRAELSNRYGFYVRANITNRKSGIKKISSISVICYDRINAQQITINAKNIYNSYKIDSILYPSHDLLIEELEYVLNTHFESDKIQLLMEKQKHIEDVFIQFLFCTYMGYLYKNMENINMTVKEEKMLLYVL